MSPKFRIFDAAIAGGLGVLLTKYPQTPYDPTIGLLLIGYVVGIIVGTIDRFAWEHRKQEVRQ